MLSTRYCGRFAPTPSGPLHAGSLLTALAGWLCARTAGGEWLLRFDDLDAPRCPPDADTLILRQLEAHGLYWDGSADYQSRHLEGYRQALLALEASARLYACHCTRAMLAANQASGPDGAVYRNLCRPPAGQSRSLHKECAIRFQIPDTPFCYTDAVLGRIVRQPEEIGDFVLRRADGQIAYQLASVVDEARMKITDVVRGRDLLASSIRQQLLQSALQLDHPAYLHLPLVLGSDGRKLSKQNGAASLDGHSVSINLQLAMARLGLPVSATLAQAPPKELLSWAVANFQPGQLARSDVNDA